MIAAIICNGSIKNYQSIEEKLKHAHKIICADGGIRHAYHMGIAPDVIIGDLDSSKIEYIKYFESIGVPFIKYDSDKDKTDTHICVEFALETCDEIWLIGATGSRLDHTLANLHLLKLAADKAKKACIIDENNEIYVIKDSLKLDGQKGDFVSLLPLSSKVEGITITGVYYPLEDAAMEIGNPYGVSNVYLENSIFISVKTGYLIVVKSRD